MLGPVLFSVMINDIKTVNAQNELVRFADDLTSMMEVSNIREWSEQRKNT